MELRYKRRMRMPIYALPGFDEGKPGTPGGSGGSDESDDGLTWSKGGNIAGAAIGHVGDIMNSFGPTKSARDLQNEAGTSSA
jgi:hypothetical protein